jgi:flagellar biogenesis protein FliO
MPLSTLVMLAALPERLADLGGTDGPDLTRYLLVSSALLLAVAGLAFGFRRFVGKSLVAKAAKRSLQVMDVLPLGSRQRLAVVRCYDRTFLLGLGERELALVAELDAVIAPERQALPSAADRSAFARWLERSPAAPAPPVLPAPPAVTVPAPAAPAPASRRAANEPGATPARERQTAEWVG